MAHGKTYERVNARVTELDYLNRDSGFMQDRLPPASFNSSGSTDDTYSRTAQTGGIDRTSQSAFGVPGRKPYLETMDVLALLLALTCLAVALCSISSKLSLAWHLGYNSQLIVIGFLLSIMNLALNRTLTSLFFMLEVRFGSSTLQNYEALLRRQPLTTTHISTLWRVIMTLFIALPLGLSAGYKRYFGGETHAAIPASEIPFHMYGTTAVPGLNGLGYGAGMAILINSSLPFMVAAANDTALPANFSAYYGQNVYTISNTSAAMLDLPMPELVSSIQQSLQGTFGKKSLSAKVHAFVTTYNVSAEQDRNEPGYWDYYWSMPRAGTTSVDLFTGYTIYTYMNMFGDSDGTWMFVAMCQDFDQFNSTALRFDTYRHACDATWDITSQSMNLVHASCDKNPLPDQTLLTSQTAAINYWYTDVLADTIGAFAKVRADSGWRMPSYVVSVASMYWARITALVGPSAESGRENYDNVTTPPVSEVFYPVPDHTMVYTKACIDMQWSLIIILALQPLLIVFVLILKVVLHATPVGEGFGLVTILAGLNTKNVDSLQGASLTGSLRKPVRLAVSVVDDTEYEPSLRQLRPGVTSLGYSRHVSFAVDSRDRNDIVALIAAPVFSLLMNWAYNRVVVSITPDP